VSSQELTAAEPSRRVPLVHGGHLRVVGATAGLVAVALAVGAGFAGSPTRLPGGIRIAGVEVGGLSPRAAVALLTRRSEAAARQPVVFTGSGRRFGINSTELGVSVDWPAAVADAEGVGSGQAIIRGFRRLELELLGRDIAPPVRVYTAALDYEVGVLAQRLDRPVVEPRLVRRGTGFTLLPGRAGLVLDQTRTENLLIGSLASLRRGVVVALPLSVEQPSESAAQLVGLRSRAELAVSAPIALTYDTHRLILPPGQLARMLAFQSGQLVLGGRAADVYFARLARLVSLPAYGARFSASGSTVHIVGALEGRVLDVPQSAAAVVAASERSHDRVAALVLDGVQAGRSTKAAAAMGITGLVGSYETVYGGVPNRIHNVELVAHLINGKLIAPGATFSFNRATGARTAAKGFLTAPVIINGEVESGLGGGVCQVSTTVFNAAFVAGLPITARTNHALYISHYPLGRDATVDYPDIDLRFVNDTSHWLLVRTVVGPSSLIVSLYGTPQHRRIVTQTAPLTVTGPMPIAPRLDSALPAGERVILTPGMPAQSTSVRRWVYAPDGKLLSDAIWYSNYRAVPEVVLVGPRHHRLKPVSGAAAKAGGAAGATAPTLPVGTGLSEAERALR
jgi:vancomycin resistance protein YoaR